MVIKEGELFLFLQSSIKSMTNFPISLVGYGSVYLSIGIYFGSDAVAELIAQIRKIIVMSLLLFL